MQMSMCSCVFLFSTRKHSAFWRVFPQLGLPIRGSYCVPKQWVSCSGLRAPRVPWRNRPPRVPWASRAWFLAPKWKVKKCQKKSKMSKTSQQFFLNVFCWRFLAKLSKAKQRKAKQSKAKHSIAKQSKAKLSKAKQSIAKQSKTKHSKAKQS